MLILLKTASVPAVFIQVLVQFQAKQRAKFFFRNGVSPAFASIDAHSRTTSKMIGKLN
jgi:hypothetical protein